MTPDQMQVVRSAYLNRELAREAVAAYKEQREPNFAPILKRDRSMTNGIRYMSKYRISKQTTFNDSFDPRLN